MTDHRPTPPASIKVDISDALQLGANSAYITLAPSGDGRIMPVLFLHDAVEICEDGAPRSPQTVVVSLGFGALKDLVDSCLQIDSVADDPRALAHIAATLDIAQQLDGLGDGIEGGDR